MNTGECMEYAQKLCNAQTSAERNSARAELREAINAAVAAERERCAKLCESREPWSAPADWWRIATKRDVSRHTAKHLAAAIRNT